MAGYIGSKAVLLSTTAAEVSGDADIGGSVLVDTIKADNGTTAMTINSSGDIIETNYEIDMFRLTADLDTNGTLTNWERVDDASFAKIGTGMTVSSGIFTFPRTGLYRVDALGDIYTTNDDLVVKLRFEVTQNNSDYTEVLRIGAGEDGTDDTNNNASGFTLVNVTNTSNVKVRLVLASISAGGAIEGDSSFTRTALMFERKGPSQ